MPAFWLSLGSNVGDRVANLSSAIDLLRAAGLSPERISSLYQTEPVGEAAGPGWFLNIAAGGETLLAPEDLLELCQSVERGMGRRRDVPGGPRTIDVDLLMLGNRIVSVPGCEVPHPRMHLRRFVLEPLAEIAGGARHPVLGLTVEELLERLDDPGRVVRIGSLADGRSAAELLA
jgi:2-amino-4-hydroxy-6-hydroxymethyldihydropteridine diphosphokinase